VNTIPLKKRIPSLLLNVLDSTVRMYRINTDYNQHHNHHVEKALIPWLSCPIMNKTRTIRSAFSPISPPNRQEAYFATGSEDTTVRIFAYPVEPPVFGPAKVKQVDELSGHRAPVLDVSWNYDETLLASTDGMGTVIVWKKS